MTLGLKSLYITIPVAILGLISAYFLYVRNDKEPVRIVAEGTYRCFQAGKEYVKGSYIKLNTSNMLYDSRGVGLFLPEGCLLKEKYVE